MIYLLKPKVSEIEDKIWDEFYKGAYEVLKNFKPQKVIEISSIDSFSLDRASPKDLLIFFNPNETNYGLNKILESAMRQKMEIFPIATSELNRKPLIPVQEKQSFDIVTEKKLRGLDDEYIKIIGECFGREVIVSHFPALFDEKIKIFLSHRRKDGEEEALFFKKLLHSEKENVFIDLHEVKTGEDAQEKINEKLKDDTDILIFIQTKTTKESIEQLKELKKAFELSIPVLWVTIGLDKDEFKKLLLHPIGRPHFEIKELNSKVVNEIMGCAFDIIKLKKQRLLDDIMYRFQALKEQGVEYKEICDLDNIYDIELITKDKVIPKREKKEKRLFKCLCRKYKKEDIDNLKNYSNTDYKDNCILSLKTEDKELENGVIISSYDSFFDVDNLLQLKGGVILSGSFPDNIDLKHHQNIIDALSTFTDEILRRGGKIIFGSHQTFQGIILERAKKYNLLNEKKVKLYVSKYFEGKYDIDYFKENSEVFEVEKSLTGELGDSLKEMRNKMITDSEAIALVCIGGKEIGTSLTDVPGLDEEIDIAKKRGIPVYILGGTGGRSKELIKKGFKSSLENEREKEDVEFGNNFKQISEIILNKLSTKEVV